MACSAGRQAQYSYTARRNNSLSPADRILAFGFIALVSLAIATAFACLGAWPILPFAGIEVVILIAAYRWIERHERDYERLTLEGDRLLIEIGETRQVRRYEFNRWWAQVVCERNGSRLALRSHGREIEFGRYLTDEQRQSFAGALKRQLGAR